MKITKEQLNKIIGLVGLWVKGNIKGVKTNLPKTDLLGTPLGEADPSRLNKSKFQLQFELYGADLRNANLSRTDLLDADLSEADLSRANCSGADFSDTDLSRANFYGANFAGANFYGANFEGANFSQPTIRVLTTSQPGGPNFQIVPESGSFYGYKQLEGGFTAYLKIPKNAKRVNAIGSRKCRAEFVKVIWIKDKDGNKIEEGISAYRDFGRPLCLPPNYIIYKVGSITKPDSFNDDIREECASGTHFFLTKKEAEEYS